ncbi:hypothetical protein [Deinococcus ficus]|uniref:hypothetical protein n=1 Tax=Deinococcus ficus TaxID=317577 RepID=UPI0012DDAD2E|nr:hypothetical protein [Deinococcus ficus]
MIKFIDAVMGSGKSTYAIQYVKSRENTKFIIAAITLSEVERYSQACDLPQPHSEFSKMNDLENRIKNGESVVITHALFLSMSENKALLQSIKQQEYILILDEVLSSPIYPLAIEKDTLKTLRAADLIDINGTTGKIQWLGSLEYEDRVSLRDACLKGEAYAGDDSFAVGLICKDLFVAFDSIIVLTYMAEYSLLYKYFEFYSLHTVIRTLRNGKEMDELPVFTGKQFANLISIDQAKRRILKGIKLSSSSVSRMNTKKAARVNRAISGFFDANRSKANKQDRLWTTYKTAMGKFSGSRNRPLHDATNFLQHTSRGTNDYQNVVAAAYALDKYLNPGITKFLSKKGISYKRRSGRQPSGEDMWALSEMLQWLWRTRIRTNQPIELYVPAERMNRLLSNWLT